MYLGKSLRTRVSAEQTKRGTPFLVRGKRGEQKNAALSWKSTAMAQSSFIPAWQGIIYPMVWATTVTAIACVPLNAHTHTHTNLQTNYTQSNTHRPNTQTGMAFLNKHPVCKQGALTGMGNCEGAHHVIELGSKQIFGVWLGISIHRKPELVMNPSSPSHQNPLP